MVQWNNLKTIDLNIETLELAIKELKQMKNPMKVRLNKVRLNKMYLLPKDKKLVEKICGE